MNAITLRDANQTFARRIRDVEAGAEYIITRNGTPVARLSPVSDDQAISSARQAALSRTQARMEQGWSLGGEPIDRDALHER